MVRTYRLGGAERERARALIRILSIDMDRVRWLDGHPMTVRVFDDGKCWVEYTGLVVCDKEDIDFCLRGLEPVDVRPGSIGTGSGECRNRILREDTRMSLDFEVSTIATMTVPDSWRLSLEAPRYSTIAPPVGVTRMSRSVSHPLLRSIHPSPSVFSTPQSVERYRRRSASKDSSNAVNPIQLSASHFHMAQILATKKCRRLERRRMSD